MSQPPTAEPVGALEVLATFDGPMPTGVTVSQSGRIFVNYPKWGDEVPATVTELRDGQAVAFPDEHWNRPKAVDDGDDADVLVSVQSVVVDPSDRLWILDTGSRGSRPLAPGGPKLVCVDLPSNSVVQVIVLPPHVALPTTYLNDVRFDLRRGEGGTAFITDSSSSGRNGIIVVDLASADSWRRLDDHPSTKAEPLGSFLPLVEGRPFLQRPPEGPARPLTTGSDGITIGAGGERLYYCPLMSRRLYSVSVDALADPAGDDAAVAATVVDEGDKGSAADGLESDDQGRIYITAYEHNAVLRRLPDGQYETLVQDPRLLWPDTLSVATDGHLYVTANQLHRQARFHQGQDRRRKPYGLFRVPIDAGPVLLRP